MKKDCNNLDEVIKMMSSLCEAWDQVASQPAAQEVDSQERKQEHTGADNHLKTCIRSVNTKTDPLPECGSVLLCFRADQP